MMKASAITMSNSPIKHVEQEGKTVRYFLSDGTTYTCSENDLVDFIETHHLNVDQIFSHNDSPLRDSNPAYDIMATIYKDPQDILTDDWEMITEAYYKHIFRLK